MSSLEGCVRWRGQSAVYTSAERLIMADLPVREQAFVHTLKATLDGEIKQPELDVVYTDPEELEFGKPKRKRPVYALVCTWKQSCVVPTKREGEFWTKVWKAWYEWRGWKVNSHDTGYFAAKGTERHSIGLHEYDRDTHERIK